MSKTDDARFGEIWRNAKAAAQLAAEAALPLAPGGCDCGFAWVTLPGNMPFGRYLKKIGVASKGYPSGLQVWYSKLHTVPTQSVSVHEAAARAAYQYLAQTLGSREISMGSRLD